ncbi:MAG: phosphotransferase [Solirubrobacteraceae bacterium]
MNVLRVAGPAGLAPLVLGQVAKGWAQEALEGDPLRVEPLSPAGARRLGWPFLLGELARALTRLGEASRRRASPDELRRPLERALADGAIGSPTRRLLAAAWRDLRQLDVAVLRHRDTSPQNCLFSGGRFVGLVDWEDAAPLGARGYDTLNGPLVPRPRSRAAAMVGGAAPRMLHLRMDRRVRTPRSGSGASVGLCRRRPRAPARASRAGLLRLAHRPPPRQPQLLSDVGENGRPHA